MRDTKEVIVRVALYAHRNGGTGALSTGEALAAALVLNRADWLAGMQYTIGEALDRIGAEWVAIIPSAEREARLYIEREGTR